MFKPFDLCVLTAANDSQAQGFRARLQWRKKRGMYPETEFLVISDPDGVRIGSGGSTLYVLQQLLVRAGNNFTQAFHCKRVLIIHSGGDSRRLPAYSSCGKIFTPLPTQKFDSLFDVMLANYSELPFQDAGHVIIASGDVLLNFAAHHIHFSDQGMTAVAYPDDVEVAGRHGVFIPAETSCERPVRVQDFLQKPSPLELETKHATDVNQRAWVDTGIIHLAPDAVRRLLSCTRLLADTLGQKKELNLYQHIPLAILKKIQPPDHQRLERITYHVSLLPYCGFFHIGRSIEFLNNFHTFTHAGAEYGFKNGVRSNAHKFSHYKKAFIFNSFIQHGQARINGPAIIENCIVDDCITLAGENIVTGLIFGVGQVRLDRSIGLSLLPLQGGLWTAIIYGMQDHFKTGVLAENNLFMNRPISQWLAEHGLTNHVLWPNGNENDLWQALLFPVCTNPAAAIEMTTSMQSVEPLSDKWRHSRRKSMKGILQSVDYRVALQHQEEIARAVLLCNLERELIPKSSWSAEQLLQLAGHDKDRLTLADKLVKIQHSNTDLLFNSRICYLLSRVCSAFTQNKAENKIKAGQFENQAFTAIRQAVNKGLIDVPIKAHHGISIRSDEVVWVCAPARLDFAGGWSDTPPYCLEQGGAVLNAAVILNGQYPIQVIAKMQSQPVIRVNSIDLGATAVLDEFHKLRDYTNPADWLSLPKAAFQAAGILSGHERASLRQVLQKFGGGIDLTLFSALPAGSGLGTSSILGAATIAALARMFGLQLSHNELFLRTSYMEQLMTTGGGWQDQIGGVVSGVKLIETRAGLRQEPTIQWTHLFDGPDHPFLLYYTGIRRMAKNILRHVVSRYLNRDPQALQVLSELKSIAHEMKTALDERRMENFGQMIQQVWQCNNRLDEGSTTGEIEQILKRIGPHIHGAKLLGAGGGGFLFIVCKSMREKESVYKKLVAKPINDRARFFDFSIDQNGLRTNVL